MNYKKTTQAIMNMTGNDIISLSHKEAYTYAKQLQKVANKRIDILTSTKVNRQTGIANSEYNSKAYTYISKQNILNKSGKYSISKNMSVQELKKYLTSEIGFLNAKTSTLSGIKETSKSLFDQIGLPKSWSARKKLEYGNLFWDAYKKYEEEHADKVYNAGSPTIQKMLRKIQFKHKDGSWLSSEELKTRLEEVAEKGYLTSHV